MKPEMTLKEIHQALIPISPVSLSELKRRSESWGGRYVQGRGKGGRVRLFYSGLLPYEIRMVLQAMQPDTGLVKQDQKPTLPVLEARKNASLNRKQEDKAFAMAELARAYAEVKDRASHGQKKRAAELFLVAYNLGESGNMPAVYAHVGTVATDGAAVNTWISKLKKNQWDPMCLVDLRGHVKHGARKITKAQIDIILKVVETSFNRPDKPIDEIIRQAADIMASRGIDTLSKHSYRRWLTEDWIPYNYDKWMFWRHAEKGLNDHVAYTLDRDYDKIEPGELLVADGHVLNFQIKCPFDGKPKRMMMILFFDAKANYPLGWEIMPTENTQAILAAFRRALIRLGKLCKAVYIDNGKAFKSLYFTKLDLEAEHGGVYQRLGIQLIVARPYHGQSKTVERFFRIFGEIERLAPSYVGPSIDKKPAHLNRGEKLYRKLHEKVTGNYVPTLEEAHQVIAAWFDVYVNRSQTKRSHLKGKAPADVMVFGPGINPEALRELMMAKDERVIRKQGIEFRGNYYYHPLLYGQRHKVVIRYDLQDQSSILVYDQRDGEFICEASLKPKVHPMAYVTGTEADQLELKQQLTLQAHLKKQTLRDVREFANDVVIKETRKTLEASGFSIDGNPENVSGNVKKLPERKLTDADRRRIEKEVAELEAIHADEGVSCDDVQEDYIPEVVNEAEALWDAISAMDDADRYEKLIELEVKGTLIPSVHQAWMRYFEMTSAYQSNETYFAEYRTKMVLMYSEAV